MGQADPRASGETTLPEKGAVRDDKPSSLITSYHYLRYILLGFFLYVSHKYIQMCYSSDTTPFFSSTPVRLLLTVLYAVICLTLLAADIRNYVLYKLLLFEFYQDESPSRGDTGKSPDSDGCSRTLENLIRMLEQRRIAGRLKGRVDWLKREDKRLKEGANSPLNCIRKLRFNWMMFWAVQPGPVSCCIIVLYTASFIILGVCTFWLGCWARYGQALIDTLT